MAFLWIAGMAMAVALHPERGAVESKRTDVKQRRVVVTGMGVVTPLGHDPNEFYNNLLQGLSGISEIEEFDCSNYPTVFIFLRITFLGFILQCNEEILTILYILLFM
jgi:hypothetical protein